MRNNTLRDLQMTQFEMLCYVDEICRKHNLKYSLYAGTLLGAVRHKGFIPWDDDLDICLSRSDYHKLINILQNDKSEKYFIQNKDNTPSFTQDFTKIRKYNTDFLTQYDVGKMYHTGIFIDIFPVDRVPVDKISKYMFYFRTMIYHLMIREFAPKEYGKIVEICSFSILFLVPKFVRKNVREYMLNKLVSYNGNPELPIVMFETVGTMKKEYDCDLTEEYVDLEFEGRKFMCFSKWHHYLTQKYGDYNQLPPEKDREWKHLPLNIDFEMPPKGYER